MLETILEYTKHSFKKKRNNCSDFQPITLLGYVISSYTIEKYIAILRPVVPPVCDKLKYKSNQDHVLW
jgi:hypothetical protein